MVVDLNRLIVNKNSGCCKEKHAFTMIELIFAIVVIGVSMLAIPMVVVKDASNQESSLTQEGIMLTTTKVSQVLTYPWDPLSSLDGDLMSTTKVLDANGDPLLNRVAGTDFRIGHFAETLRRKMTPISNPRVASAIGPVAGAPIGISSLNGDVDPVGLAGGQFSYKKQWNLVTTVAYVADASNYAGDPIAFNFSTLPLAGGATSNIKMVQVTATDVTPGSAGNQVLLTSYSSNIGEAEFYKRRY